MKIFSSIGLFGSPFIFLKEIPSTNSFLKEKIKEENFYLQNGLTVWAWQQTNGYGRYHRKWQSKNGKTATFSFVFESSFLKQSSDSLFIFSCHLNQVISFAIILFLKEQYNITAEIKFPNDIYVAGNKISGILIENVPHKKKNYCVVGIGINLFSLQNDSFSSIVKEKKNSNKITFSIVLKQLLNYLQDSFFTYRQNGYSFFKKKIEQHQMIINKEITFYLEKKKHRGKIISINDDFSLLVEVEKNHKNIFYDENCKIHF